MYKCIISKLNDIFNCLKNIFMSYNFQRVFTCRIIFPYVFICRIKLNDICLPA